MGQRIVSKVHRRECLHSALSPTTLILGAHGQSLVYKASPHSKEDPSFGELKGSNIPDYKSAKLRLVQKQVLQ